VPKLSSANEIRRKVAVAGSGGKQQPEAPELQLQGHSLLHVLFA